VAGVAVAEPEMLLVIVTEQISTPPPPFATPSHCVTWVTGWAEVVGVITITDPDELARLDSKLIWTHEYAASRLGWKARQPLWVLALRAYQLEAPCTVPYRDEYGGCTSWVEMDGLPDDPTALAAEPALTDETFAARLTLVEKELGRSFEPPAADQDSGDSRSSSA